MRAVTGLLIPTLESPHEASFGDYIIKGVKGEFYPCKPDIFHMTYNLSLTNDGLAELLDWEPEDEPDHAIGFKIDTHDGYWLKVEDNLWIFEPNENNSDN